MILSFQEPNGELHPVTFLSRTFTLAKLDYDVHDKELLAIYEAFKAWGHYCEGSTFSIDVITDHKNLEYFLTMKCSPGGKLIGLSTFVLLTWLSGFGLVNLEPNPMHLLLIWTSTLRWRKTLW